MIILMTIAAFQKAFEILANNLTWERFIKITFIVIVSLIIEMFAVGVKNSSIKDIFNLKTDNLINVFSTILSEFHLTRYLSIIFSFGLFYFFEDINYNYKSFSLVNFIPNTIVRTVVSLLAFDCIKYWSHRMLHKIPFLWEFHKFHHSGESMSILLAHRFHPMETIIGVIVYTLVFLIMGNSVDETIIVLYCIQILVHIQHSKVPWNFGKIGEYFIYSPFAHKIHHSNNPEHFDKNFGTLTPIWDKLFGTWYNKGKASDISVGISDNYFNKSIFGAYLTPYKVLFQKNAEAFRRKKKPKLKSETINYIKQKSISN